MSDKPTPTTAPTVKLDDDVLAMSKALSKQIEIKDGEGTIEKGAYLAALPEGMTKEDIQKVNNFNSTFYPAVTHAFGEKAIAAMKKDKKLEEVKIEVPLLGTDKFGLVMNRVETFRNPAGGENDPGIVKYGNIVPKLVTQSARGNRGDMSKVREYLQEAAMKALAG